MEQGSVTLSVTERVHIPPDSSGCIKFVQDPFMSFLEVSNEVFIIRVILISSNPSTHSDLQPSLLDKHLDVSFHLWCLLAVPHIEELHLNVCEHLFRVLEELKNDSINDILYTLRVSIGPTLPGEVVSVGFKPPNIVMRVRNHMNCQILILVDSWKHFLYFYALSSYFVHLLYLLLLLFKLFNGLLAFFVGFVLGDGIDVILRKVELTSNWVDNLVHRPQFDVFLRVVFIA